MKRVLLAVFVCFFLSDIKAQPTDSLFLRAAFLKLQSARDYTLAVARLMPAQKYSFKPSADEMSFGEQVLHLSANLGWLSSSYLRDHATNPVTKEDLKLTERDSILAVVERTYAYALRAIKAFPPARLGESVEFFAGPMQMIQIINLINDHQTHHRAQLIVYLRVNGIKPPPYVGW